MVKPASNRPKTSKRVQARPSVQNQVAQRITELRKSGMGFRKISKRLEKEGLATISKSTVANYCDQAQTQSKTSTKKLHKDPALRALAKTEAKLQSEVNHTQMVTQARQRIRDLQVQKAETLEGLQDIFRNSEELKEFVQQTLYDSPVLKTLKLHCEANRLPLAETLSNVVGSLDKYEAENEDMCGWPDLPSYIEEQLDIYLTSEQHRKMQEQLPKKAPDFLLNFKCSFCGAPYETMTIDSPTGEILCNCGKRFKLLCPGCKGKFAFDSNKAVFYCRKCNLSFERPTLTYRDFTFRKEPAYLRT